MSETTTMLKTKPVVETASHVGSSSEERIPLGIDLPHIGEEENSTQAEAERPLNFATRGSSASAPEDRELGRGRSGIVFLSRDETGRSIARKLFGASGVTKLVQYAFLGAPNPYAWCEPAIKTAVLRRRILAELVEFWFGTKLRVSRAYGYAWNEEHRAFEMNCELIDGRHVALHHCYTSPDNSELRDATREIMKPLQEFLIEAGFDGLVWQAGRGNPVALNNFMCEGVCESGGYRWAWIDLESGVPALIPMNPLELLKFYLPKSFKHRGPLFDDVDVDKLRAYLLHREDELEGVLGADRFEQLDEDIESLARAQWEWKSMPRHRCSIGYHRAKESISAAEATYYGEHPLRWYARESLRAVRSIPRVVAACTRRVVALATKIDVGQALRACWDGLRSQAYRERMAREYVGRRIDRWTKRAQLSDAEAAALSSRLQDEESSSYLTDFGVHLAVKPVVKLMQFWLMPALWMAGAIDDVFLAAFMLAGGCAVRTIYTLGRIVQNSFTGRERPWVALGIGVLPVVGNVAFPLQVIFSGAHDHRAVARFILFDTFARFGKWFPIWGGADTLTEHFMNRLPRLVLGRDVCDRCELIDNVQDEPRSDSCAKAAPEPA
jgi:hypothetical protein